MSHFATLRQWEQHPSRALYAFCDTAAREPREQFLAYADPTIIRRNDFYIETCAYGQQFATTSQQWRDHGIAMMRVGLSALADDGSYAGDDAHHSVSFFAEAIGRAALLADDTGLLLNDEEQALLRRCGLWFADPSVWADRWWRDTMHHRFFLNAAALYLLDRAVGLEPWCVERAGAWAAEGVRRQRHDGAHTEMGGHDTGYHSLAMTFTAGTILTCDLPNAFEIVLRDSLSRAASWLVGRVDDTGAIDASGNTRMTPTKEVDRFGVPKAIKPYESAFALAGAGLVLEDQVLIATADRIMARSHG